VRLKSVLVAFGYAQGVLALLFAVAGLALTYAAGRTGWEAIRAGLDADAAQQVIEAIGLLAAAVVALQIAQTIAEEEVIRDMHVSAPTRVRRFLSRFFVVLMVALAIEGLVATFKALHEDLALLPYAASLIAATGVLLLAWGVFIRLNRAAEELEPDKMKEAQQEDEKLK
jgi:hypothetical protein